MATRYACSPTMKAAPGISVDTRLPNGGSMSHSRQSIERITTASLAIMSAIERQCRMSTAETAPSPIPLSTPSTPTTTRSISASGCSAVSLHHHHHHATTAAATTSPHSSSISSPATVSASTSTIEHHHEHHHEPHPNHPIDSSPIPESSIWSELDSVTKVSAGLIVPTVLYYAYCTLTRTPPSEHLTFVLDTYSQIVGLYALRKMHNQLKMNLGVRPTLARTFQAFSFFGSALCTTSFLGQLGSYTGKMYFSYNLLNTLAYGYFIYLTLLYNKSVPDPREKRRVRGVMHTKSFLGYLAVTATMFYVWIREAKETLLTANRYTLLAVIGFVFSALGILKGGFETTVTSIPVISPFSAVAPLALTMILLILTKIPHFSASSAMRIYVAGYAAIIYCLIVVAYLAFKAEQRLKLRTRLTARL